MKQTVDREGMISLARYACDTMMRKYDAPDLPPVGQFHYHQGVFLSGVLATWRLTGDDRYFDYVKSWVDARVQPDGNILAFNPGQLDDLQPGVLLFPVYERTEDDRYKLAMDTVAHYMQTTSTNPEGGFWHKAWYRNQMWLDGLYMAGPFMTEYGVKFHRPDLIDQVLFQARMMRDKTRDAATGLWHHAWDYERRQPWADAVSGKSPEFWGRSMGWVPVALIEEYELLPKEHPVRYALAEIACDLLRALLPWQDASGLWYQVVDKGGCPGNWLETSCTCLYATALCMASRLRLMDAEETLIPARRAISGVVDRLNEDQNGLRIEGVCVGTSVGDYDYYCARPTGVNDLHGVGAFLLMCSECAKTIS